jgi:hypothetical protein
MLTLLRLPLFAVPRWLRRTGSMGLFLMEETKGAPPLALPRVKRRPMPAPTRAVSPVFRASARSSAFEGLARACADPLFERPLKAGDPPPPGSPWRLLPPVSPTGRGAGVRCALRP